jgi:NAD(P)-dependent dehydrogenase (short-subunit alcohol dehydrogenase family)
LRRKNVLVTGGMSAIGQAIAVRFADNGDDKRFLRTGTADVMINVSSVHQLIRSPTASATR